MKNRDILAIGLSALLLCSSVVYTACESEETSYNPYYGNRLQPSEIVELVNASPDDVVSILKLNSNCGQYKFYHLNQ